MRDHTRLRAFELADELAVRVYKHTAIFPKEEMFGLTSQLRRAVGSIASNIVERCARHSESEYIRFLEITYGSAREVEYQIGLSHRLGLLPESAHQELRQLSAETAKVLNGLLKALRRS